MRPHTDAAMKISDEMRDWLESDQGLEGWAFQYLMNKEMKKPGTTDFTGEIGVLEWADRLQNTPQNTLLLIDMKAAWGMKQRRKINTTKKSCTFELDVKVKAQLDYLAKRQSKTITETLEGLIKRAAGSAQKADAKTVKDQEGQEIITSRIKLSEMTINDLIPRRSRKAQPKNLLEGKTIKDLRNGTDMPRWSKQTQENLAAGDPDDSQSKKPRPRPHLEGVTIRDLKNFKRSKRQSKRARGDLAVDTPNRSVAETGLTQRSAQNTGIRIDSRTTLIFDEPQCWDPRSPGLTFDEPQPD